jgi:hypothetical protein
LAAEIFTTSVGALFGFVSRMKQACFPKTPYRIGLLPCISHQRSDFRLVARLYL